MLYYVCHRSNLTLWTAENVSEGWAALVGFIMFPVPMFAYLVRDMWRDAKREVEWENSDMMRRIKGDDYSDLYEK